MKNKRGLSKAVTTMILVLLILVAIGIIWGVVNNLIIKEGVSKISLRTFTVETELTEANLDYNTGIATIKVKRNSGEGNLSGIKVIMKNETTTEVFTRYFIGFDELEERTIIINITEEAEELRIVDINKISIIPIITLESGKEVLGKEEEEIGGFNDRTGGIGIDLGGDENDSENETLGNECTINDLTGCYPSDWIGEPYCNLDKSVTSTYQFYRTTSCFEGFCIYNQEEKVKESCATGSECSGGQCVKVLKSCVEDSECGTDGFEGLPKCINSTTVGKDYRDWTCESEICESSTETKAIEFCLEEEICGIISKTNGAECFVPLECTSHKDCIENTNFGPGYLCEDGKCILEIPMEVGTINSIWPFFVGEYFDSADLPRSEVDYTNYYIIFPGSEETRCLMVREHIYPNKTEAYAYLRLIELETNISSGDQYQIWETNNACLYI